MRIEREVKLDVPDGFVLPALDGLGPDVTVERRRRQTLDATYYDTGDLRLARAGVSLRHRVGDERPWTVKLAAGDRGPVLSRREISFDGPADAIPADAARLVAAYARREPLAPVARLRTARSRVVLTRHGTVVAEVTDDAVAVHQGRRIATRFREVEVEEGPGATDGLLPALVAHLREAGARESNNTPKVVRALGPQASNRRTARSLRSGPTPRWRRSCARRSASLWPGWCGTTPASGWATTRRTSTRPASEPAGSGPICARSARCSTGSGCPDCAPKPAGTPDCSARCATARC